MPGVVPGDLVLVGAGDQVVADGPVVRSDGLGVDESILTGESEPVTRGPGESLRAGSFAVEGSGAYVAEAVGRDTYAERLTGEAREFRHPRSPLERALDRLILVLTAVMVPLGALLLWSLIEQDIPFRESVETAVAAVITIVPEGLVLLTGHHLRGRDAAHDPAGGPEPAAQRGRVAGVGRHGLPRQDRHAHRGPPAGGRR